MFPSGAFPMPRLEHATPEQLSVEKKNNENLGVADLLGKSQAHEGRQESYHLSSQLKEDGSEIQQERVSSRSSAAPSL